MLAVNHEQLAHAVKALYGNDFDAEGYLRRFFDIDFRLPEPKRDDFIAQLLSSTGIGESMVPIFRNTVLSFFDLSPLSLRDIAQAVHRIGLVFNSLSGDRVTMARFAVIALIMRSIDKTIYHRFVYNEISDGQAAKEIFAIPSIEQLRWEPSGILFQIGLVLAYKEVSAITTSRKNAIGE